jgi:hypothetical protein
MVARRLCIVVMAVAALAGCGNKVKEDELGRDEPTREGLAVEMGDLTYNVFITRQLNPRDAEDRDYYRGGEAQAGNTLYGVFLQVCNKTDEPLPAATDFTITDTLGRVFYPTELADTNLFAYRGGTVEAQNCIPKINSAAWNGPIAGSMLLFNLPLESTENRPLELKIVKPPDGPGKGDDQITVKLDI